jgi:tetratricopeptide (TPR) repeat protein
MLKHELTRRKNWALTVAVCCVLTYIGDARAQSDALITLCASADPAKAIAACSALITQSNSSRNTYFYDNRGVAYQKLDQLDRALSDFDEAIRLWPYNGWAYFNRANLYQARNELHRALTDYDLAIHFASPSQNWAGPGGEGLYARRALRSNAFAARGDTNMRLGRPEQAIRDYDSASESNPESVALLRNRGVAYAQTGRFGQAIENLDEAIQRGRGDAVALYTRGVAKKKTGDAAGGEADLAAATAIDPNIPDQMAKLGITPKAVAADPHEVLEQRGQDESLCAALTSDERQAIEMTFFAGLTNAEAAARLNQPLGTIETRIRSGQHKLQCALAPEAGKP